MAKRVILYLRVSTRDQNTDNQLSALRKWVSDRGYEIAGIYQEQESAWRAGHQHEFARLMKDLPRHRPQILLVWALDRLTRQGIGPILQIVNSFKAHGVQVISYQESWTEQMPGPMLELWYAMAGWAANFESTRLSERVLAGLDRARAQGKALGRRPGSKDKGKRKRTGYLLRYAKPSATLLRNLESLAARGISNTSASDAKQTPGENDDGAGVANG